MVRTNQVYSIWTRICVLTSLTFLWIIFEKGWNYPSPSVLKNPAVLVADLWFLGFVL